jgi:tRNA(adenine34) deaminase
MQSDRIYIERALEEAQRALTNETIPVGSVLVGADGEIIGRGRNRTYSAGDCSSHAEIEAIRDAGSLLLRSGYRQKCILYTTVEPCMMCTGPSLLQA